VWLWCAGLWAVVEMSGLVRCRRMTYLQRAGTFFRANTRWRMTCYQSLTVTMTIGRTASSMPTPHGRDGHGHAMSSLPAPLKEPANPYRAWLLQGMPQYDLSLARGVKVVITAAFMYRSISSKTLIILVTILQLLLAETCRPRPVLEH
jgi:hypothetical protein